MSKGFRTRKTQEPILQNLRKILLFFYGIQFWYIFYWIIYNFRQFEFSVSEFRRFEPNPCFSGIFIHNCRLFMKCFIFTKLSQIVCLINVYILVCQHAKCDCRLWKLLWFNWCILWEFAYITICLKRYVIATSNF